MHRLSLDTIPADLLRRVVRDAATHFGLDDEPVATAAWEIINPYSRVLCIRLTRADWQQRLFIKLPPASLDLASSLEDANYLATVVRKEFEALESLAGLTVTDAHGRLAATVVPLAFYADLAALVTIEAAGPTLRKQYRHAARIVARPGARANLLDTASLCGRWLARFHEETCTGHAGFDLQDLQAYCEIRLGRLRNQAPHVLSAGQAAGLQRAASVLASEMAQPVLRVSGRHNDFASHNIIAAPGGGIRVLDFTMLDHGENAFDVCNFWFELEMLKCDPTYSRSLLDALQQRFLDGYGGMSPDAPDFQLARLRFSINRLLNILDDPRAWRHWSPHWRSNIRAILDWLNAFEHQGGGGAASGRQGLTSA